MDRNNGEVPSDNPPMHDEGWIADDLSEAERTTVWWNGFDAMCKVHRLDWKALGFDFLLDPKSGARPLDQQLHYWQEYFEWGMPRERHPDIAQALDYLEANKPEEKQIALCWGDSRLANEIFDNLECAAVIDWEMARIGDPVQGPRMVARIRPFAFPKGSSSSAFRASRATRRPSLDGKKQPASTRQTSATIRFSRSLAFR